MVPEISKLLFLFCVQGHLWCLHSASSETFQCRLTISLPHDLVLLKFLVYQVYVTHFPPIQVF